MLAIADVAIRLLLDFNVTEVLRAEFFLFSCVAVMLLDRIRREDSSQAWPRWIRLSIAVFLLLGAVRALGYSMGLGLFAANLLTFGVGVIVVTILVLGRRRIERNAR